jgi:hypothetical protein
LTFNLQPVQRRETPPSLYKEFSGRFGLFFPSLSSRRRLVALFPFAFSQLPDPAEAMGFGDLKSPAGLQVLNDYLADKSYIEG